MKLITGRESEGWEGEYTAEGGMWVPVTNGRNMVNQVKLTALDE